MTFEPQFVKLQIEQGGWILLATLLLALMAYRETILLFFVLKSSKEKLDSKSAQSYLQQWKSEVVPRFERRLKFASILIKAAPLMGLLGTVLGLYKTFKVLAHGQGHAMDMISSGVSQALITTEMGLLAAIPGIWMIYVLKRCFLRHQRRWEHSEMEGHRA